GCPPPQLFLLRQHHRSLREYGLGTGIRLDRAAGDPDAHVPGHPEAVVLLPSRHAPGLDERARVSRASDSSDHSFACRLSLWLGCPYPRLFFAVDRLSQWVGWVFHFSLDSDCCTNSRL